MYEGLDSQGRMRFTAAGCDAMVRWYESEGLPYGQHLTDNLRRHGWQPMLMRSFDAAPTLEWIPPGGAADKSIGSPIGFVEAEAPDHYRSPDLRQFAHEMRSADCEWYVRYCNEVRQRERRARGWPHRVPTAPRAMDVGAISAGRDLSKLQAIDDSARKNATQAAWIPKT